MELAQKLDQDIRRAAAILRLARKVVVLTGAGISTPSGIPDFRSPGSGLWTRYDPFEVASLSAFRHNPERFFAWMRPLAVEIAQAKPNPAHLALAELEQAGVIQVLVTQNIDGLHQKAGSQTVLEVHGTMRTLTCVGCYRQYPTEHYIQPYLETGEIPRCLTCRQILKPDVVLFEEQLPIRIWLEAQEACRSCDVLLVAGSSLEVVPVAGLPSQALECGARLIIINQSQTYLDGRAEIVLRRDVAIDIPQIVTQVLRD